MKLSRMMVIPALAAVLAATAATTAAGAQGVSATAKSEPKAVKAKGHMPAKATASCNDGSWSTAASQQGACSSHGGVATWFGTKPRDATARCGDGSYYENAEMQGACSGHGGIAMRYKKAAASASKKKG